MSGYFEGDSLVAASGVLVSADVDPFVGKLVLVRFRDGSWDAGVVSSYLKKKGWFLLDSPLKDFSLAFSPEDVLSVGVLSSSYYDPAMLGHLVMRFNS
jgi:hypothetical protein